MKKFMENYGYQLLTIAISCFIYMFVSLVVPSSQEEVVLTFFRAGICFAFGLSLYQYKKSKAWVKKVVIVLLFVFLMLYDMNYNVFPSLVALLKSLYIKDFILNLLYVFLGWTFFY